MLANALFFVRNGFGSRFGGGLLGTLPRARCKELARDIQEYFASQEYVVEVVVSTFYEELWGDKPWKGG